MSEKNRPLYGTKKGDVYSFGIIVQESLLDQLPYGVDLETMTPEGKADRNRLRVSSLSPDNNRSVRQCVNPANLETLVLSTCR